MSHTTSFQQITRDAGMDHTSDIPEQYWNILEQYREELTSQAAGILGNREDAEDVVQETFCEVLRDAGCLEKTESVGATLRMINRRNSLNRMRS